jgi:hypothetical protein
MTLLIACLLIAHGEFHPALYVIATIAWMIHVGFHKAD